METALIQAGGIQPQAAAHGGREAGRGLHAFMIAAHPIKT
jgi:hypothetical protein